MGIVKVSDVTQRMSNKNNRNSNNMIKRCDLCPLCELLVSAEVRRATPHICSSRGVLLYPQHPEWGLELSGHWASPAWTQKALLNHDVDSGTWRRQLWKGRTSHARSEVGLDLLPAVAPVALDLMKGLCPEAHGTGGASHAQICLVKLAGGRVP